MPCGCSVESPVPQDVFQGAGEITVFFEAGAIAAATQLISESVEVAPSTNTIGVAVTIINTGGGAPQLSIAVEGAVARPQLNFQTVGTINVTTAGTTFSVVTGFDFAWLRFRVSNSAGSIAFFRAIAYRLHR